jgi:hypothetical protein
MVYRLSQQHRLDTNCPSHWQSIICTPSNILSHRTGASNVRGEDAAAEEALPCLRLRVGVGIFMTDAAAQSFQIRLTLLTLVLVTEVEMILISEFKGSGLAQ